MIKTEKVSNLTDDERAAIRRYPEKVGYIGLLSFRGPRGRNYRSIRTKVHPLEVGVDRELANLRARPWKNGAFVTGERLLCVDAVGNVIAEDVRR